MRFSRNEISIIYGNKTKMTIQEYQQTAQGLDVEGKL